MNKIESVFDYRIKVNAFSIIFLQRLRCGESVVCLPPLTFLLCVGILLHAKIKRSI